jgi:hypothetical protein
MLNQVQHDSLGRFLLLVLGSKKKGMGYLFGYRFLPLGMMIQPMR